MGYLGLRAVKSGRPYNRPTFIYFFQTAVAESYNDALFKQPLKVATNRLFQFARIVERVRGGFLRHPEVQSR